MKIDLTRRDSQPRGYLEGQMLLAMPAMRDPRFVRSLIYICGHSDEGAMGIVINRRLLQPNFPDLLTQLEIIRKEEVSRLPQAIAAIQMLQGGPVETGRGFVLHSADFDADNSTVSIARDVCMTATIDILRAIANGRGPQQAVLALGYAGWGPGQLEAEMESNSWLSCPADGRLIFDGDCDSKYTRVLRSMGIDPAMLSSVAGRA